MQYIALNCVTVAFYFDIIFFLLHSLLYIILNYFYRAGILKAGDRLLAVDGINLSSVNLQEALQIMKQLKQFALFTIEYDVSCIGMHNSITDFHLQY